MGETLNKVARSVRNNTLSGFRALGGFDSFAASAWRRRRLLILCYHGVSLLDEHEWNSQLFVTPAFLRRRFEIIRDGGYAVLPLDEAIRRLRSGNLPPQSLVLTFDDGFYNFLKAAVPLLEEFGYPATNYISTYHCLSQTAIPRLSLRYLLWRSRSRMLAPGALDDSESAVDLADVGQREALAAKLFDRMSAPGVSGAEQQARLEQLARRLGVDWHDFVRSRFFHLMSRSEVAEVARRGFDVQLHTHRHRVSREKSFFVADLAENRRILEETVDRPVNHFCYPGGEVDRMLLPWLRELGVATATTTAFAQLAEAANDPLLLPRYVDTMAKSEVVFESWLSGAGALLTRRGQ